MALQCCMEWLQLGDVAALQHCTQLVQLGEVAALHGVAAAG